MDISLVAIKIIISILYIFSFGDPRYAIETFKDPISNIPSYSTNQLFNLVVKDHGMVIYNTNTNTVYTWSGREWIPITNRILFSYYISEPSSVTYNIKDNGLIYANYSGDCILFNSSNSDGEQKNNIIFQYHNPKSGMLKNIGKESTSITAIFNGHVGYFYVMKIF
jgi:hypothetical protein